MKPIEETLVDVIYRSPPKIVQKLRPGATGWIIRGNPSYECLEWDDENYSKPTEEEWNAELDNLIKEFNDNEYKRGRVSEYPPLEDFVDAYYWMQKGDSSKMDIYIMKCDEIKQKYPKLSGEQ